MLTVNLSVVLGCDRTWMFRAWDQSGLIGATDAELDEALRAALEAGTAEPLDISTGYTFTFVVRKSDTDRAPALLEKATTIVGTYSATVASNTQRIVVALVDTDLPQWDGTDGVKPDIYRYALKRTTDAAEEVFARGDLKLLPSPAR